MRGGWAERVEEEEGGRVPPEQNSGQRGREGCGEVTGRRGGERRLEYQQTVQPSMITFPVRELLALCNLVGVSTDNP